MAIKYFTCEPFRAYNRLEGRPRKEELGDALAAKIHDPLWMMTRQFQFGELKGEDAGSAIFAKAAISTVRLNTFIGLDGNSSPYSEHIPLEARVERLMPDIDLRMAAKLGRKFLSLLDEEGQKAAAALNYGVGQYKAQLLDLFPFSVPQMTQTESPQSSAAKARMLSLQQATSFLRAISGRALNGKSLWEYLSRDSNKIKSLVLAATQSPTKEKFVLSTHQSILVNCAKKWIEFVVNELNLPDNADSDCWSEERLEYSFQNTVKEANGGETQIGADEYFEGHLDWYSFDVTKENPNKTANIDASIGKRECITVIPSEASFAGMPSSRWWELEDGSIDLGNLQASDTDIAKILVTQYALQYSNDWLSIPYDLPTGTLAKVEGIIVRDTFGQNILVEAAHKAGNDWNEWNMYAMSIDKGEFEVPAFDKRIFLPPSAVKTLESDSVEEIKFIRDEMANMVWGVESRVPDGLGNGIDGYEAAKNFEAQLEMLKDEPEIPERIALPTINLETGLNKATTYKPQLKYQLGNIVSENWIPFVAAHQDGSNREIHFQRASMPRLGELFDAHAIRPRTPLLRDGINENDHQDAPLYINEEEIPRAGVRLTGTYQRTRWYNGKIVCWYGRRKRTGRGEGSSGLSFDLVLENK